MKYLIIGNSAAAVGAIEGIRSRDARGEIVLIGTERRAVYSRPAISYYLAGQVDEEHMYFRSPGFYNDNQVETRLGQRVTRVLTGQNKVFIESAGEYLQYDRLLITSGGRPSRPACFTGQYDNIFNFYTWDDVEAVAAYLEGFGRKARVLVAGAGLIGLKAAESFIKKGHEVKIIEAAGQILPSILNAYAAARVQAYLEGEGISFYLNNPVQYINGVDKVESVVLMNNRELEGDLLITATGTAPEVSFLSDSGIEVNKGIITNKWMQSSSSGVYAAGDVAEAWDSYTSSHRVVPVWPFAYRQGFIAGANMTGGQEEWNGGPVFNSLPLLGMKIATGGQSNLDSAEGVNVIEVSRGRFLFRQLMIREGRLEGFVLVGDLSGAGVYHHLVESGEDVNSFQERLGSFDFGIIDLPGAMEKVSQEGGY